MCNGTPWRADGVDAPGSLKGNINSNDEYIYHIPGQQAYTCTIPERCFATAAQAEAADFVRRCADILFR